MSNKFTVEIISPDQTVLKSETIAIKIWPILYLLDGNGPASPRIANEISELYFTLDAVAKSLDKTFQSSITSDFKNSSLASFVYRVLDATKDLLAPGLSINADDRLPPVTLSTKDIFNLCFFKRSNKTLEEEIFSILRI